MMERGNLLPNLNRIFTRSKSKYNGKKEKVRNVKDKNILRISLENPYSMDKFGPLYCVNSITNELYRALFPEKEFNRDGINSMRIEFLRDTVWTDASVGGGSGMEFEIPIYQLKDLGERKRLGLEKTNIARWMSTFVESKNGTTFHGINEILTRLQVESTSWLEAKRLKLNSFEAVSDQLRLFDQLERLYDKYTFTVVELNDPKCPITRFVALDIEAYERAQRKLTEFGIAIYDRDLDWLESHHIIVKEHSKLRNSDFAPDAKDDFAFGVSNRLSTSDAMHFLSEKLDEPGTALVGHALSSDLKFLRQAKLDGGQRISDTLLGQVKMYDTQYLHRCKKMSGRNYKLTDILKELGINCDGVHMHNAGNDATLTMRAFIHLMGLGKRETAILLDKQNRVE